MICEIRFRSNVRVSNLKSANLCLSDTSSFFNQRHWETVLILLICLFKKSILSHELSGLLNVLCVRCIPIQFKPNSLGPFLVRLSEFYSYSLGNSIFILLNLFLRQWTSQIWGGITPKDYYGTRQVVSSKLQHGFPNVEFRNQLSAAQDWGGSFPNVRSGKLCYASYLWDILHISWHIYFTFLPAIII